MTFQKKLSDQQIEELIYDYRDGWRVRDLTIIYRVSVRTVYRILAEYQVPRKGKRYRKRRKTQPKNPRQLKPCGTNAAYQRHKRKGEYPCAPCLAAHSADVARYK